MISTRNMVLLLPFDESREERRFYCTFPSVKNIVQDGSGGEAANQKGVYELSYIPKPRQAKVLNEFSYKPFITSLHLSYWLEECCFLSNER